MTEVCFEQTQAHDAYVKQTLACSGHSEFQENATWAWQILLCKVQVATNLFLALSS